MPDDVAAASDDVQALLRAYDGLLRWECELPRVVWLRRSRSHIGRHMRVPRVRASLRWLLVSHMQRTLGALRAELHAREVSGADRADPADRAAIESFLRSLPTIPTKRLVLFVLVGGFGLAHFIASGLGNDGNEAAEPLGNLTRDIIAVSPDKAVSALGQFHSSTAVALAVLCLGVSFYVVLCVPATAFRLKRILLNLGPDDHAALAQATAADHVPQTTGVYELERGVARRLDTKRSVDEPPLDLYVSATLVVPAVWAGLYLVVIAHAERSWRHMTLEDFYWAALAAQVLLLPGGRLALLARIAGIRRRGARTGLPSDMTIPSRRRRLAAAAIDTAAVLALAVGAGVLVGTQLPDIGKLPASALAVIVAPTLGAALYTGFSFLSGDTLGRRWTGLRLVDFDGTGTKPAQVFARDVVLKWGIVNTLGFSLLWLHALVIYLWPLWDPQRRTLCDVIAGTVVVHEQREPAVEAELVPSLAP